ncbi:MAG: hypothetical protein ASARMPRED_002393 [Alectoria sarmentosa]|nr:MAG: hypothetical protein ASARMPRED_002393 [Alectoria sarmentosa]
MDRVSVPYARQDDLQIPPSAHIDEASIGLPNGDRGVETFSNMFSDCGFMVNDSSKRRSILSTRSQAQDRWSFAGFKHEDVLELSTFGIRNSQLRNSQLLRLPDIPDQDRDLESPTTLVEEENSHYQEGSQLARLPVVEGMKLWLFLALLLSALEQLIVGTALTAISSGLGQYSKSVWVVTAYLMSYNGFLLVFARCGDIFGRRTAFMVALIIFTVSSLACGVAQTMTQLIVFRAFQGIGGSGLFTLTLSVATEIPGKARTIVQEGGTEYAWDSGAIVSTLVIQAISWVALVYWEVSLTSKGSKARMLPIWPSRLFNSRVIGCAMLAAFFSGIPLYSIYIYLPQRFQIVNGLSPLNSGIHLLLVPLVCFTATGIGSGLSFITNVSYPLLVAALALQCLSIGLMTTLPSTASIPASLYGYESILGFGFGLALPTISTIARMELSHFDHSVNMAAISSLRSLGGTIGIAIGNIVLSSRVWNHLSPTLNPAEVRLVIQTPEKIPTLTPDQINFVREAFGEGFNFNTRIILYFSLVAFVFCLGCFVKNPLQLREVDDAETKAKAFLDKQALDREAEAG